MSGAAIFSKPDGNDTRVWIPARDCVPILFPSFNDNNAVKESIRDYAAAGLIASRCLRLVIESRFSGEKKVHDDCVLTERFWSEFRNYRIERHQDWVTGAFFFTSINRDGEEIRFSAFNVSFAESDIGSVVPPIPQKRFQIEGPPHHPPMVERALAAEAATRAAAQAAEPAAPSVAAPPAVDEPDEDEGPPVSDLLLKAWYDLYCQAYPGADDTEPMAIRSAHGMFPGKSITRIRIRKLRDQGAPKKPGPKPKRPA